MHNERERPMINMTETEELSLEAQCYRADDEKPYWCFRCLRQYDRVSSLTWNPETDQTECRGGCQPRQKGPKSERRGRQARVRAMKRFRLRRIRDRDGGGLWRLEFEGGEMHGRYGQGYNRAELVKWARGLGYTKGGGSDEKRM